MGERRLSGLAAALALIVLLLLPQAAQAVALSHVVQSGETLEGIARHYGTHPDTLARINGLHPPLILQPGQRLLIWGSTLPSQTLALVEEEAVDDPLQLPPGPSLLSCTAWPAPGEPLAARVNGWGIGLQAFEQRWAEVVAGLRHVGIDTDGRVFQESAPKARARVLSQMIDEVLVQQGALAQGIVVDGQVLAARLAAEVSTPGRRERFEGWLAQTEQTWDSYRRKLCQAMLAEGLAAQVGRTLAEPTQAEALERWLATQHGLARTEIYVRPAATQSTGFMRVIDRLRALWAPVVARSP